MYVYMDVFVYGWGVDFETREDAFTDCINTIMYLVSMNK